VSLLHTAGTCGNLPITNTVEINGDDGGGYKSGCILIPESVFQNHFRILAEVSSRPLIQGSKYQ